MGADLSVGLLGVLDAAFLEGEAVTDPKTTTTTTTTEPKAPTPDYGRPVTETETTETTTDTTKVTTDQPAEDE